MKKIFLILLFIQFFMTTNLFAQSIDVPARNNNNLLLCSWNIKWFKDTGKDLSKIAKVISNFDICGIVELQSDRVLKDLANALEQETGEEWMYIQSNHTGHASYNEQYGFIWRDNKLRLTSGHIGNVQDLSDIYRHEPYIASFKSGGFDFRFMLVHTRWTTSEQREAEVEQIANDLSYFQNLTKEKDIIVAGDFNYSGTSEKMEPILNIQHIKNLVPPESKTTLKGNGLGFSSWYDHIFILDNFTTEATGNGGAFDFVKGLGFTSNKKAKEISDHIPVWAEFKTDNQDDD